MKFNNQKYLKDHQFLFADFVYDLVSDVNCNFIDGVFECVFNRASNEGDYIKKNIDSKVTTFSIKNKKLFEDSLVFNLEVKQELKEVSEYVLVTFLEAGFPQKWELRDDSGSSYKELGTKIKSSSIKNDEKFMTIVSFSTKSRIDVDFSKKLPVSRISFYSNIQGIDGFYHLSGKYLGNGTYELSVKFWDKDALKVVSEKNSNIEFLSDKDFENLYLYPDSECTYIISQEMIGNINITPEDLYMSLSKIAISNPKAVVDFVLKESKLKSNSKKSR